MVSAEVAEKFRRLTGSGSIEIEVPVALSAEVSNPGQRIVGLTKQLRISANVGVGQLRLVSGSRFAGIG